MNSHRRIIARRARRRSGPGLALWAGALLFAAHGCRTDEARAPSGMQTVFVKLEWGSLDDEGVTWPAQVALSGATVLQVLPYELESGDTFSPESLRVFSWTEEYTTDGMLLALNARSGATLTFYPGFGTSPEIDLDDLLFEAPIMATVQGQRYLYAARLTPDEWTAAIGYAQKDVSRSDMLPQAAYERRALAYRYDSSTAFPTIQAKADDMMETDPFFAYAEAIRQGVNQQLYVTVPSVLGVGESFDLAVAAFDLYGRLVDDFDGEVRVDVDGDAVAVPSSVPFTAGADSLVVLDGAGIAVQAGFARIVVTDPTGRFSPGAIPVLVEDEPDVRLYWGDLHTHTRLSDGDFGDIVPEDVYRFGRDVGRLDFVAITDHDYRRPIPDWKWPLEAAAAEAFYDPGHFVTFLAYEWSAEDMRFSDAISHKNVYYRTTDAPIYSAWDVRYNTPDKLWAALRTNPGVGNALTIPHHPVRPVTVTEEHPQYGGPGTDWNYYDDELQTLVEVYSRWGVSETNDPDNPRPVRDARDTGSAQVALSMGHLVGFMASSDTHDGKPGVSVLPARLSINDYPVGVVGIYAPALTRDDLFDALVARRCYGTSGGRRMILSFQTDTGLQAGDIGRIDGPLVFYVTAAGTTTLASLALLRVDGEGASPAWETAPGTWLFNGEVSVARGTSAPSAPGGFVAYYLRVTQVDGEMGWIGPIFLAAE